MDREKVIRLIEEEISVCESVNQCYRTIDLPALRDILTVIKEQDQMYYTLEHDWRMCRELLKEQEDALEQMRLDNTDLRNCNAELLKEHEAKTGRWIYKKYDDMFMCSCCEKYSIRNDYPYCHWCGAKMEGRELDA